VTPLQFAEDEYGQTPFGTKISTAITTIALVVSPSCLCRRGDTAITNGKIALVYFDDALQALSPRTNHRPAKAMQNSPGSLVTTKAQHALQAQGAHA
jgi:hypothetical protein